ncbi:MAG: sulfurtransferase [Gammaproteobacteria bacterium]|nr:sulfurtransferase [Gammaproteobacteria bacterium]
MCKIINMITLVSLLLGSVAFANDEFPGRVKYKTIPYIELEDLYRKINDVVVVDARSKLEFETLRIRTAVNIPVAGENFEAKVAELRATTNKAIVFYCNGHTCMKSYIATKRALDANISDVLAFDAGIFDWTKAHPDQATLLGSSPVNLAHLIPKSTFKKRLLSPNDFSDRATIDRQKYMIIDVRDKFQRAGVGFYPGIERWASLDQQKKLDRYVKKALRQNRTLLIYDEVGKQVRWLQYALEKAGAKKYYFMKKGAKGYYKELIALGNK